MSGKTISTSATRAEALTLQSSTFGATIAWLRGANKLPGNLIWYGDFKAIPHTTTQGGKGGGGVRSTTYTYSASLIMGLCHGSISSVQRIWKGKGFGTTGSLGLTELTGAVGQSAWSGLAGKGVEELGYSGLACIAGQDYDLGDSASVENHSFEVRHTSVFSVAGDILDVDPAAAMYDLMTDTSEGAGLAPAAIASWATWSDWCIASGLLVSPAITEQVAAIDALRTAADLTNTGIVWSDGKIKMVPYADQAVTGNGRTFTPDTTPVYQLDDTCYTPARGQEPVRVAMKTDTDMYNHVRVEYKDRANAYQVAIAEARDLTDISINGLRSMPIIPAHWICVAEIARRVAEMRKQRSLLVVNTYTIDLPINYALIEPMDLLTLTDSVLGMSDVPVRVTQIQEAGLAHLQVTCEDFPAGSANAPRYAAQVPAGYASNYLVAPGSTSQIAVFEAPGALATGGSLEVWVGARGAGAYWGGCTVWVSLDGTTYRAMGRIEGGSRIGTLTGPVASGVLPVQIGAGQQLISTSTADAAALNTLCYVGGSSPEYLGYETATLTGAGAYNLGGLVRAAYGTTAAAHAAADEFVFVDDSLARSGVIDPAYIGKTIYIKCTSFNVFSAAEQSLADVSPVAYAVTGAFVLPTGGSSFTLQTTAQAVTFNGSDVATPASQTITLKALLGGLVGTAAFTATRYNAAGASLGTVALGGSGNTRTLTETQFGAAAFCVITATLGTSSDQVTIVRLRDGQESVVGLLSNESANVAADNAGTVVSFAGTGGTFRVFRGLLDLTGDASVTYSVSSSAGVTIGIASTGVYTITALSTDTGTATLRADCAGVTLYKVYSIAKSKAGSAGSNGSNGSNGANGSNGSNGSDGLNSATVFIFTRNSTGTTPSPPASTLTYTFSSGLLSGGSLGVWSQSYPAASGGQYLFASTALASAVGPTDTIATGEWATVQVLVKDDARPPGHWYTGGSSWSDSVANALVFTRTGTTPILTDIVTISDNAGYSETKYWFTGGFWVSYSNYISGTDLVDNAATSIYQDSYDFGGVGYGTLTVRTFTVTPTGSGVIEVSAVIGADNVYGDAGNKIGWYATPSGGSRTLILGTSNNDTVRKDFTALSVFPCTAGVPVAFSIETVAAVAIHLFKSNLRLAVIKK